MRHYSAQVCTHTGTLSDPGGMAHPKQPEGSGAGQSTI